MYPVTFLLPASLDLLGKPIFSVTHARLKNGRILLANLFPRYNAEIYAELFPGLGAFKAVKCGAKV
jgi:hypothetical protein